MKSFFYSVAGNRYFYSPKWHSFHFQMERNQYVDLGTDESFEEFTEKKKDYFVHKGYAEKESPTILTRYSNSMIEENLANIQQLLIEVTDGCNLSCKYCGYGELYENYDKRTGKKQCFDNVKTLIDFMVTHWKHAADLSYENVIYVGFYGGEPLLNFELIKETIAYVEALELPVSFEYNMTTNAVLLDRYMDFLVQKKFHLLISLDGDKSANAYRVRKDGTESFDSTISNVDSLKTRYPAYFEKYVEFNSVLHNKNSVENAISYIYDRYGKITTVGELATNGIAEEKREEFSRMYSNRQKGFEDFSERCGNMANDIRLASHQLLLVYGFLDAFVEGMYRYYIDLFASSKDICYFPTGTCSPFSRKIFLTVNGKLFPCEKIGQITSFANVSQGEVHFDVEKIIEIYQKKYESLETYCKTCARLKNCGLCAFLAKEEDGKAKCHLYSPINKNLAAHFSEHISFLEKTPDLYHEVLTDLKIS